MSKPHQKHAKLARPSGGEWGRAELALVGAPDTFIRELAGKIMAHFTGKWKIGFASALTGFETLSAFCDDAGTAARWAPASDVATPISLFSRRVVFNDCDLVLVNGGHYHARQQIVLIHPGEMPGLNPEQLSDVRLILFAEEDESAPDYLQQIAPHVPRLNATDKATVYGFFETYLKEQTAALNGLVLTGGNSARMGRDKSLLHYHGRSQRDHVYELLQPFCDATFISCNAQQSAAIDLPKIEDRFLGIGPLGGLLSAFQSAPDKAWLSVACDMPHLNAETLELLTARRNPAKFATAFINSEAGFPEPLLTIWEPKAYLMLLQALSMGVSCPRKVLINADVELIAPPQTSVLRNVNDQQARRRALAELNQTGIAV